MKPNNPEIRWWDFPAISLLLAALLTTATRLVATGWTIHLDIIQTIVVIGFLLGIALGYSKFSGKISALLAFLYGLIIVPWQLGSILKDEILWPERLVILSNRSGLIINQIMHDEVVHDSLLFLVLMSILFWVISVFAAYHLVRYGNAWLTVFPAGLTVLLIHSFDAHIARRGLYIVAFFFFSLVLIARMVYLQSQNRWKKEHTALPPHLGYEFIRIALILSALIILFAWTFPALAKSIPTAERAWQPVKEIWDITRDRFDNVFASLKTSAGMVSNFYGKSAILGRGNILTDSQVFQVEASTNIPQDIRLYWRARTYDTYENGQWISTKNRTRSYNPEEVNLIFPQNDGRFVSTFKIITASGMTSLYTPVQPVWVSRKSLVELIENPDGTMDISTLRASPSLDPGQTYRVQASLSFPSIQQLRRSGSEYPDWISERYLQLPESITPRTRQLAQDITASMENPYDKVVAITDYLRNNIEYVDIIPSQPENNEAVDWILFDLKQGFCNYYATAEIVLLRSVGIPARFSIGFAQGEYIGEDGRYIIRQRDAHAWPEVYFVGTGWVEFEPTTSQPTIVRPVFTPINSDQSGGFLGSDYEEMSPRELEQDEYDRLFDRNASLEYEYQESWKGIIVTSLALISSALMLLAVWRFRNRLDIPPFPLILEASFKKAGIQPPKPVQIWAHNAKLSPLSKAYQEINHALARIGEKPVLSQTPLERAHLLGKLLPSTKEPAKKLVNEYQIGTFSSQAPDLSMAKHSGATIRKISYRRFINRLLDLFQFSRKEKSHPLFKEKDNNPN